MGTEGLVSHPYLCHRSGMTAGSVYLRSSTGRQLRPYTVYCAGLELQLFKKQRPATDESFHNQFICCIFS